MHTKLENDRFAELELVTPVEAESANSLVHTSQNIQEKAPKPEISNRIGTLNGLRGIACLFIVYCHSYMWRQVWVPHGPKFELSFGLYVWPLTWLTNAGLGVDMFFTISGFVLYLPYCTEQRTFTPKTSAHANFKVSSREFSKNCMQFYKRRC